MPLNKLTFRPGINTQATPTLNEGGWSESNLVRWKDSFLEKVGGWTQLFATAIAGLARGMHAYQGLANDDYLLIGSDDAIQVYFAGTLYDMQLGGIVRNLADGWLTSSSGSTTYEVHDPSHGRIVGDLVQIVIPASVGGITLFPQIVTVASVVDVDHYTFVGDKLALSNDSSGKPPLFTSTLNSGNIRITMTGNGLSPGDIFIVQLGVSVGGVTIAAGQYEAGTLDSDNIVLALNPQRATSSATAYENADEAGLPQGQIAYTEIVTGVNNWFLDNFGNIGLLCFENGPIFVWSPPPADSLLATALAEPAPQAAAGMFVAMPQAQIIAFGAEINGIQDALLLRWCDAGDYTVWTASATNQAGSFRLSRGSKIVGGLQAPQVTLIWTDIDLWSMQYVGPPFIYSFNIMGSGCGLIAPRACTTIHNITYWMSQKQFFVMGQGGVAPLPCPVWDVVFNDLDQVNVSKCFAGSNSAFNEVWFFYPSASGATSECDSYVKYNVTTQLWDYGRMDRTAWIDQTVFGPPISADTAQIVQQQEEGYDANGLAMEEVFAQSGYVDIAEGDSMIFIDQIIPDFKWFGTGGSITLTVYAVPYPGSPSIQYGPFTVTPTTRFISLRARARQLAFRIEWAPIKGFSARVGAIRYRGAISGRRP